MPRDVLTDLLVYIEDCLELGVDANTEFLKQNVTSIKDMVLSHDMSHSSVLGYLTSTTNDESCPLFLRQKILKSHSSLAEENKMHHAQLLDNVYGRVFESVFTSTLVEHTPDGVLKCASWMSKQLIELLTGIKEYLPHFLDKTMKEIAKSLSNNIRPWCQKDDELFFVTPELDSEDYFSKMLRYLDSDKSSGQDIIKVFYLYAKIPVAMREANKNLEAEWLSSSTLTYQADIVTHVGRYNMAGRIAVAGDIATGIGSAHNPVATKGKELRLTTRPSAHRYRMGLDLGAEEYSITGRDKESYITELQEKEGGIAKSNITCFPFVKMTKVTESMLLNGVTVGCGVSGSAYMMTHAYVDYCEEYADSVDKPNDRDFILGTCMMLLYDGGHSINEVLWVINAYNREGPNFGLNVEYPCGTEDKMSFISNFRKFIDNWKCETEDFQVLQKAVDEAFTRTSSYYRDHSCYYQPPEQELVGIEKRVKEESLLSEIDKYPAPIIYNKECDNLHSNNKSLFP